MDPLSNPYADRHRVAQSLMDAVVAIDEDADVETNDKALHTVLDPLLNNADLDPADVLLASVDVITFFAKSYANRQHQDVGDAVAMAREVLDHVYGTFTTEEQPTTH